MNPHRLWTAVGVIGATVGLIDLFKKPPVEPTVDIEDESDESDETESDDMTKRKKVVEYALAQEGKSDPSVYWDGILPDKKQPPKDWCGALALKSLHVAGVTNVKWKRGLGFLAVNNLPITSDPLPGDIAYFTENQHQAVVIDVNPETGLVELINGNSTNGEVVKNKRRIDEVHAFYSIQPWLDNTEENV
jgi:hypothetical protein